MKQEDFFIRLENFSYDQSELHEIYKSVAHKARLKGLKWKPATTLNPRKTPYDPGTTSVIQYGNKQMLVPSKSHLSCNFLEFDYIRQLVSRLNFDHEILPNNCDMLIYNFNSIFPAHTDHYAASTMMWPILPEDSGEPIHFYHRDDFNVIPGEARSWEFNVTDEDIVYTHYYGTQYPTIFNSHTIHAIPRIRSNLRVSLRLRLNESYESILSKHKSNTLVLERPGDSNLHL